MDTNELSSMFSRILVPVDGSEESRLALTHAITQFPEADLIVLHVVKPFADHTKAGGHPGGRLKQVFEERQRLLDEMVERIAGHAGTITTALVYGRPVYVIPQYVEAHEIDEVVIGSRGRDGTARLLLGSVAQTVVRRVPVPVTIVRSRNRDEDGNSSPERVLVPFDCSSCSRNALKYAFDTFSEATVTALFVKYPLIASYEPITSEDYLDEIIVEDKVGEDETKYVFEMVRHIAGQNERDAETATEEGEPSRAILKWIDENDTNHVVIGSHGRSGVARWLLGSVSETVVRRAPVPVTVVK